MTQDLEELVQYIRQTLPQSNQMRHMAVDDAAKVVTFEWQSRRFAVQLSLRTFEMKGTKLFITGASGLLQDLLARKASNREVIGEVVKTIQEIEGRLRDHPDQAMELLQSVKRTLEKRIPNRTAAKKTEAVAQR